jgi:penicillin-binding protein 2
MKNNKIYEDLSLINRRARITFIAIVVLFVFLVLYFWKIQVLDYQKYWTRSEDNRTRIVTLSPQRGLILASDNTLLADNKGSYKVSIIRENCTNFGESLIRIAELLELEVEELKRRIDKYKSLPLFRPIVIKDNLTPQEVSRIEARKREMPELLLQAEPRRHYPRGNFASHVLGYLQEVSLEELKSEEYSQYRPGDLVGKTGIEKQYEHDLRGAEGQLLQVVDSLGRVMAPAGEKRPIPGKTIWLTLDVPLQEKAEEILEGREGAIIVMDPRNGEILAWASYPDFDPNKFINRFSPEEWTALRDNPDYPLENRAIRGHYAPGSVFKLTMGLVGLQTGAITERTTFFCGGSIRLYKQPRACWYGPGHGAVNLHTAIKHSCNIYFYQTGMRLGIDTIARYAHILGLGEKTGVDLPGEHEGLIPTTEWKKKARGEPWYPGETISVSIGQGPMWVTPLQVAVHTAIIANRGRKPQPRLVKKIGNEQRVDVGKMSPFPEEQESVDREHFEKVIQGAWMAVNKEGTAAGARVPGFDVCGKTGSTQVVGKETAELQDTEIKTHSWFTGFAPKQSARVVVTILIEYGGGGGETAAPLSSQLFELYKETHDK